LQTQNQGIPAENFFLVHTLADLLTKCQINHDNDKIIEVTLGLAESVIKSLAKFKQERNSLDLGEKGLNYYDKRNMREFLIQSKNGCLNSELDILTYLSKPLINLLLRKVDLEASKKVELVCRLIYGTLSLSNLNWIITKNIILLKSWLRTAGVSYSESEIISYLVE
jgi:hypothetical protein